MGERLLGERDVGVVGVRTGAQTGDPLVDGRRRVRHRADDGDARRRDGARSSPSASPRRPRAPSARCVIAVPISPSSASMSCGFTEMTTSAARPRPPRRCSSSLRCRTAPRAPPPAPRAAARRDDLGRLTPAGGEKPGDQRLADPAGAEDRDAPLVDAMAGLYAARRARRSRDARSDRPRRPGRGRVPSRAAASRRRAPATPRRARAARPSRSPSTQRPVSDA